MKDLYKSYLFEKHILVNEYNLPELSDIAFSTLVTLGQKFGIRINKNVSLVNTQMIKDAAMFLGEYVPEPFYRGFPQTVRELTPDQLLYDQLLHYTNTYGMGWFDQPGHSTMEDVKEEFNKVAFKEKSEPKDFDIYDEAEATILLKSYLAMLVAGNRPLNMTQTELIYEAYKDFGKDILPDRIACKDTAINLLLHFRDLNFCRFLRLSDTIKVLNNIQYNTYHSENLKKLNLKNQDRKLITGIINRFFVTNNDHPFVEMIDDRIPQIDIRNCFEKRKIWCGLLHHIHYQGVTVQAQMFTQAIRGGKNLSHLSGFEKLLNNRKDNKACVEAAMYLKATKGESAVVRNMNYILSRCKSEEEIKEVFSCLE